MVEIPNVIFDYLAGLKGHDVDLIAAAVADELVLISPARTLDKKQFLAILRALYAGFPDWAYEHNEPERQGEVIVVKWRQGGTHTGTLALPGLPVVHATGKEVRIPEQNFFYRVRDDKIIEIRPDPMPGGAPWGIFAQLGVSLAELRNITEV